MNSSLKEPPPGTQRYKTTPVFTATTTPAGLLKKHCTKPGVWAVICVTDGALNFFREDETHGVLLAAGERLACPPELTHHIEPAETVTFQIEFWR